MICSIYNKILVVHIVNLIRRFYVMNNLPSGAQDIHDKLVELHIRPRPSVKQLEDMLMTMKTTKLYPL